MSKWGSLYATDLKDARCCLSPPRLQRQTSSSLTRIYDSCCTPSSACNVTDLRMAHGCQIGDPCMLQTCNMPGSADMPLLHIVRHISQMCLTDPHVREHGAEQTMLKSECTLAQSVFCTGLLRYWRST